jgi:hypothetical protein
VGHVAGMEKRNAYSLLVGKRLLGRLKGRCVDNIKMDLGQRGWSDTDWTRLAQAEL